MRTDPAAASPAIFAIPARVSDPVATAVAPRTATTDATDTVAGVAVTVTATTTATRRRGLRILVTDDDLFAATLMRRLLAQDGHTVRVAGTIAQSIALVVADPIDVLITDYLLPDGTGCELLRRLRDRAGGRAAFAISITGFHDPEHARHIAAAGFDERFVKPIALAQLTAALARVGA